jgi:hypothetical protein
MSKEKISTAGSVKGIHYPDEPGVIGRVVEVVHIPRDDSDIICVVWPAGTVRHSNSGWWCASCDVDPCGDENESESDEINDFLSEFEVIESE